MKQQMKRVFLAVSFFWGLYAGLVAQVPREGLEKRVDSLFSLWNLPNHPGGVIGLVQRGELVLARAYGLASLEYQVPVNLETVFNIASVSKQFTAFSIILLAQEGKLSLDDDVRKYLPEVPDFGTTITLRHLLTHTSGLRNFQNLLSLAGWRDGDHMTNEDLLRYVSWQKELNFPPGSEYLYCNTGFNLCTKIVERVSGKSFLEFTRERIFEPLGMESTGFRYDLEQIHPNTATSYEGFTMSGFTRPKEFWTYIGNGNVYTTVGDMAKWLGNFGNPKVGGPAAIRQIQERGILTNGDTLSYALGIVNESYRGLKVLQHGGSVGGYRAQLTYFPDQDAGVLVFTNFSAAAPGEKALALADLFLEGRFPEPKPKRTAGSGNPPPVEQPDPALRAPGFLAQFAGRYYSAELKTEYSFVLEKDKLIARHVRHEDFELRPISADKLQGGASFFSDVEVVRDEKAAIKGIRVSNGRVRNLWFEKM